jgi:DNA primase
MGKIGVAATKYIIYAKLHASGVVERPDVVGAIFGQTEGLLGEDLELRELQRSGRIGRIEVNVTSSNGKSEGSIEVPTSLNKEDTALIAAALETIERIGPCDAKIDVDKIEDVRSSKRDFVVDRAKSLLEKMGQEVPESQELSERVKETVRKAEITSVGPDKLPAGPNIEVIEDLILVEGRADVLNLLKHGIMNIVGVGGTNIPKSLVNVCKGKKITVFLDGDRGGDLILKEISQMVKVDFVARAPIGREVEEITQKEIIKALRNKVPAKEAKSFSEIKEEKPKPEKPKKPPEKKPEKKEERKQPKPAPKRAPQKPEQRLPPKPEYKVLGKIASNMIGTGKACLLKVQSNNNVREVGKVSQRELSEVLRNLQEGKAQALIVDWNIDQQLVNEASDKGITILVGLKKPHTLKRKPGMRVLEIVDVVGGV